ncbi:MAG TPA: hypothetical protein PLU10_05695 [Chitinophagaceae bacterium]|nr:hypothetical protein [Chitinophagaceae bacterium]
MSAKKEKLLFVVRALPFEAAGTPVVIQNLLDNLPKDDIYVLGRRPDPAKRLSNNVKQKMFTIPILYTKGYRFWKYFSIIPGFLIGLWVVYRYKITKIVGVFQDDASLILAYRLAMFFPEIEFYPYLMDLYAEQKEGKEKVSITAFQQDVFRRAKKVLVCNEGMKLYLDPLYTTTEFVTIPIISLAKACDSVSIDNSNRKFNIVFSGSVNEDRLEPLRVLTKAISSDARFEFTYLSNQTEAFLRQQSVFYDGFKLHFCKSSDELMMALNNADLLYLPIRFTFPERLKAQMMTCFGAKVYDYMVSNTPILIHAPDYFFNYTYFENNQAAFLLNSLEESKVIEKLEVLLIAARGEEGRHIVTRSNQLAQEFSREQVTSLFQQTIGA